MAKETLTEKLKKTEERLAEAEQHAAMARLEARTANNRAAERDKENNGLRDQLMSKTMETTRLQAILEERDRAERKAVNAAKPPVMVPLDQHPAYLERHSHASMDFEAFGHAATERREWYHRS